ncbi:unnamed protein product [Paramecium sonneborni]|uniref:Zinc/iron permease n=1 Tax=Paramecium sonneborni TaxID=65129 RepID=A0A8S1NMG5_9CILI|nr:unnamed protein product [Paramecium sonneborni]
MEFDYSIAIKINCFQTKSIIIRINFLSVGIIHLLPESMKQFHNFYKSQKFEEFPYACLTTVLSFALIMYIEKIAFIHDNAIDQNNSNQVTVISQNEGFVELHFCETNQQQSKKPEIKVLEELGINSLTSYILQFAQEFMHFEGLAIGIESQVPQCLGISLAIICHKWAEGLILRLSFKKASIRSSTIMIFIQEIINPIGILIEWILSDQGFIITGIFQSISAGTFIYIATMEVIQEKFNKKSNQYQKMIMFLFAIGFVSPIWKLEKLSY